MIVIRNKDSNISCPYSYDKVFIVFLIKFYE